MMRVRAVVLLVLVVLAIAAPAILADLFQSAMTAFREGVGHALTAGH